MMPPSNKIPPGRAMGKFRQKYKWADRAMVFMARQFNGEIMCNMEAALLYGRSYATPELRKDYQSAIHRGVEKVAMKTPFGELSLIARAPYAEGPETTRFEGETRYDHPGDIEERPKTWRDLFLNLFPNLPMPLFLPEAIMDVGLDVLEALFPKRHVVHDCEGMQVFRTPFRDPSQIHNHAVDVLHGLLLARPLEDTSRGFVRRTMAGMISQVAAKGKEPKRWHIEYLEDRWFVELEPNPMVDIAPQLLTECKLVIDEWEGGEPGIVTIQPTQSLMFQRTPMLSKFEEMHTTLVKNTVDDLTEAQRQEVYEYLHSQYGCRIYK